MKTGIIISSEPSSYKDKIKKALPSCTINFVSDMDLAYRSLRAGNIAFIVFSIDVYYFNFHLFFKQVKAFYGYVPTFLIMTDSVKKHTLLDVENYIGYKIEKTFSLETEIVSLIETLEDLPEATKGLEVTIKKVYEKIIGDSTHSESLRYFIFNASRNDLPIVLYGRTGCGKNIASKLIHEISERKSGKFVSLDLGAIPSELMDSILFGSKRGAYTGAYEDKKGLIAESDNGTLFLDEVENAPLGLQLRLLRVLEEKKVRALGSSVERAVNFRLICATNKSFKEMISEGSFREDLYYRIAGQCFEILPLEKRKSDIVVLSKYYCEKNGFEITEDAIQMLVNRRWNGNVRELFHVLSLCFINAEPLKTILPQHVRFF